MDAKLPDIVYLSFLVITGILFLVVFFWLFSTEKRLKRFFAGKKGHNLEETIIELEKNITKLEEDKRKIEAELVVVNQKLRKSIRGLETIRFNPFPDQGSNQSFAIGILNEDKDGVVISSLYARDRMSVFAKPIKGGTSTYELSTEEKEAVKKAEV